MKPWQVLVLWWSSSHLHEEIRRRKEYENQIYVKSKHKAKENSDAFKIGEKENEKEKKSWKINKRKKKVIKSSDANHFRLFADIEFDIFFHL